MNIAMEEKMLIIGAGPTGLAMARQLKQIGWAFDHVEAGPRLGGNWAHGVHDAIELVSSRKITGFLEFPMPTSYPRFPSGAQMLAYLDAYAEHFGLRATLSTNTKVVYVGPADNQRWHVCFAGGHRATYRGVLICNGHHWDRRWPDIPGTFEGEYLHAKDYKSPAQVAGRRVLVIGGGNSACDVATAAAASGASAHMSMRRGYWFMPKTLFGIPAVEYVTPRLSITAQRRLLRTLLRLYWGPYERYGLQAPDHDVFDHHPTVNSTVLPLMRRGKIVPRRGVARFEGKKVHFDDGTCDEFDLVVCATGYHLSVPFLAPGLFSSKGPVAQILGGAVPEGYRHLYILATSQVRSGVGAVLSPYADHIRMLMELQASITLPLGTVLQHMGDRPPSTHLLDPHIAVRKMAHARATLPLAVKTLDAKLVTEGVISRHQGTPLPLYLDDNLCVN